MWVYQVIKATVQDKKQKTPQSGGFQRVCAVDYADDMLSPCYLDDDSYPWS